MTGLRVSDVLSLRFWRQFLGSCFALIGVVAACAGLYDVLFPNTVEKAGLAGALVTLAAAVAYGVFRAWPRVVEETYGSPNTTIRIVPGDLFDQDAHLVIGMSDTFDTAPGIIAQNSLQAVFLRRMLSGNAGDFDHRLGVALAAEGIVSTGSISKPGKTAQYPLGTVATVDVGPRKSFCVAYSQMNAANEARATIDGVLASLSSLWKAVCRHSNGDTVAMPVIGRGQSRLSQHLSTADAIRMQVLSFWLASREEYRCGELRIVVLPDEYDKLDRGDIQQFLTSLKRP